MNIDFSDTSCDVIYDVIFKTMIASDLAWFIEYDSVLTFEISVNFRSNMAVKFGLERFKFVRTW